MNIAFSRFFQREKVAEGRMREVGEKFKREASTLLPYSFKL
jgi:hypothetical protein